MRRNDGRLTNSTGFIFQLIYSNLIMRVGSYEEGSSRFVGNLFTFCAALCRHKTVFAEESEE